MDIRPYSPADRNACLALFDSNCPNFFSPVERADFGTFLDDPRGEYLAMEHEGAVVGCGGYLIEAGEGLATLTWGMVRRDLHGQGLGRFLLLFRLREIGKRGVPIVRVHASQHAARFFEKQGFRATSVSQNGYAPGIDRIELVKKLTVCA